MKVSLGLKICSNWQHFFFALCSILKLLASFVSFASPEIAMLSVITHTSLLCCAIHRDNQIK